MYGTVSPSLSDEFIAILHGDIIQEKNENDLNVGLRSFTYQFLSSVVAPSWLDKVYSYFTWWYYSGEKTKII